MTLFIHIITFIFSLCLVWFGAGLIVNSVDKFSTRIKASSFVVSFFVLGLMTSVPEMSIGFNALTDKEPEIFTGNLLGATVVLFLLIIPLFGILGNGIKLNHDLGDRNLFLFLIYILFPILLLVDGKASMYDGIILVLFYIGMLILTYRKKSLKDELLSHLHKRPSLNSVREVSLIITGLALVLFSSNLLVSETEYFANFFKASELVLSLLILSIGTNIPELSLAIRTIKSGKKDIAFGNYLGSAVANPLILGILIFLSGGISIASDLTGVLVAMVLGIGLFYVFVRSKDELSRKESIVLLLGYLIFVGYELTFKV